MIEKHPFLYETGDFVYIKKVLVFLLFSVVFYYFWLSATATATATVAPTIGLLPIGNVKFLLFYLI